MAAGSRNEGETGGEQGNVDGEGSVIYGGLGSLSTQEQRQEDPLSLLPVVSVLEWLHSHCLHQREALGTLRLAECCVETDQLLYLYD